MPLREPLLSDLRIPSSSFSSAPLRLCASPSSGCLRQAVSLPRLRQLEGFREVLKPLLLCWPALQIEKVGTTGGEELGSCLA